MIFDRRFVCSYYSIFAEQLQMPPKTGRRRSAPLCFFISKRSLQISR
ncbi:hypothetical protein PO124_03495 [Bacillus licheniformis]|nr:hypothetical protein [Bacillus licheniformis]